MIGQTAVLTAAHCLDDDVAKVRVIFGNLKEFTAASFKASPDYNGTASNSIDVGVVLTCSRWASPWPRISAASDPVVGEAAVIAGYGQDLFGESLILRAGCNDAQPGRVGVPAEQLRRDQIQHLLG